MLSLVNVAVRPMLLALLTSCAACSGSSEPSDDTGQPIVNPTGSCVAEGSGSRLGYVIDQHDAWLPDCQLSLKREYWRVFAVASDSAYIVPRPDGDLRVVSACHDQGAGIGTLLRSYEL